MQHLWYKGTIGETITRMKKENKILLLVIIEENKDNTNLLDYINKINQRNIFFKTKSLEIISLIYFFISLIYLQ